MNLQRIPILFILSKKQNPSGAAAHIPTHAQNACGAAAPLRLLPGCMAVPVKL
jgi:hypothetical protein